MENKPSVELARRVLPGPLHAALTHVFAQGIEGCILVGGTALAGYYAGHRRSDDIDLFARDANALRAATLALRSLTNIGTEIQVDQSTAHFCSMTASLADHFFSAQAVLDPHLFAVGATTVADDGVVVATIDTLLKQKAATLVSRASEKDLYDLLWLFEQRPHLDLADLVKLGRQIDQGLSAENALLVLTGTSLAEEACGFALHETAHEAFARIQAIKEELMQSLDRLAQKGRPPRLGELVRALK